MNHPWEAEIAELLSSLMAVQKELLDHLGAKAKLLRQGDAAALAGMAVGEERLHAALQQCLQRRQDLLARAKAAGLPDRSLEELVAKLPRTQRRALDGSLRQARAQAQLLRTQNLVQWVAVQKTLLHLSHLLEIIATGGRERPTYGGRETLSSTGVLVDRAA